MDKMDPIWLEARVDPPSFDRLPLTNEVLPPFFGPLEPSITPNISGDIMETSVQSNLNELVMRIEQLLEEISRLPPKRVDNAKRELQPFIYVLRGYFKYPSSYVLANIDAIYHITGLEYGLMNTSRQAPFRFISLNGGPGGWVDYLRYRNNAGGGFGITPSSQPWDTSRLVGDYMIPFVGSEGQGDLILEGEEFIERAQEQKFDLVMAENGVLRQPDSLGDEVTMASNLIMETYVGLILLKPGGNMIIGVSKLTTDVMFQLVNIWRMAFDKVTLFTPITVDAGDYQQHLLGFRRRLDVEAPIRFLKTVMDSIRETGITPGRLYTNYENEEVPIRAWSSERLIQQLNFLGQVRDRALRKSIEIPSYYVPKLYILLSLPENARENITRQKKV